MCELMPKEESCKKACREHMKFCEEVDVPKLEALLKDLTTM